MRSIAVIGAGLSGTLLIINLLRRDYDEKVRIWWIDRDNESRMGPAYSTNEDYLLNVPVEKMGAFSKDPEHFLKWAKSNNIEADKGDYLPRKVYRKYIKELLEEARKDKNDNIHLDRITGEAEDIKISGNHADVFINSHNVLSADKVVLALGNSPPKHPVVKNQDFIQDRRYIQNPWNANIFNNISEDDVVLFLGTGQTMVDHAAWLYRKKHRGKLIAISRHGILPLAQRRLDPYPPFYDELEGISSITSVLSIIRKQIKEAIGKGMDPRAVIDSLRPYTSSIWMGLFPEERRRFLRHAARYWEIIRSRIPPASEKIIKELTSSGQLRIIAGRIEAIIPKDHSIELVYKELKTNKEKNVSANLVVNCIGPNVNYEQIDQKFIRNLISGRVIHCDPLHLGINALPDGSVLTDNGEPSKIIYTMGATLRGILWETQAAPEIRVQAENLPQLLLR